MLLLLYRYVTPTFQVVCVPFAFIPGTAGRLTGDVLRDSVVSALAPVPDWRERLLGTMTDHATERATSRLLRDSSGLRPTDVMELFTCMLHLLDNAIKTALILPDSELLLKPARELLLLFTYRSGETAFISACSALKIKCRRLNRAGETRWNSWRPALQGLLEVQYALSERNFTNLLCPL